MLGQQGGGGVVARAKVRTVKVKSLVSTSPHLVIQTNPIHLIQSTYSITVLHPSSDDYFHT